jgi:hypothetical protein
MTHSGVYSPAPGHFGIGEIDWALGQTNIYVILFGNTTPTQANAHYTDLSGELSNGVGGYTAGGTAIAPANIVLNSLETRFMANAATAYGGLTVNAYFAALQHTGALPTTSTNALLSYHDLGGVQAVVSGTLTMTWNATHGCFTNTVAADA